MRGKGSRGWCVKKPLGRWGRGVEEQRILCVVGRTENVLGGKDGRMLAGV